MRKIYLGLPAYNEEASIDPLFTRIEAFVKASGANLIVMVYDDGCVDKTKEKVMEWTDRLSVHYLDGVVNKGLGTGLNTLVTEFANIGLEDDVLVVMDCDDTHDPAQIDELTAVFDSYAEVDVVIASRYRKGATITGVPLSRLILSYGAAALYKTVHPIAHVRDYTCGYRIYRHRAIVRAIAHYTPPLVKERGFACMVELLLKLKHSGAKMREIPLRLAYDNKQSASKMDVSGNTSRLLKKLVSWRLEGLK